MSEITDTIAEIDRLLAEEADMASIAPRLIFLRELIRSLEAKLGALEAGATDERDRADILALVTKLKLRQTRLTDAIERIQRTGQIPPQSFPGPN